MAIPKIYKCCICHKVLTEYKPIRLVKQKYDFSRGWGQYRVKCNYDFCIDCYKKFDHWVRKHKEEE